MKKIYFLILYGILISAAGYGNAVPFKSFYDYSKLQLEAQLTKAKTAEEKINLLHGLIMSDHNDATIDTTFILQLISLNATVNLLNDAPYQALLRAARSQQTQPVSVTILMLKDAIAAFDKANIETAGKLMQMRRLYNAAENQEGKFHYFTQKLNEYLTHQKYLNAAVCYHALAGYYIFTGDDNATINHYLKAAELFEPYSTYYYATAIMVIGSKYTKWGNVKKAKYYLEKGLELQNRNISNHTQGNIGIASYHLADLEYKLKNYTGSLDYLEEGIQIDETHFLKTYPNTYLLRGLNYLGLKKLPEALQSLNQADRIADSTKTTLLSTFGFFELDYGYYKYYTAIGDLPKAETFLVNAYQQASIGSLDRLRKDYLEELVYFYGQKNDTKKASSYYLLYRQLKDSLETKQNRIQIATYETESTEKAQQEKLISLQQEQAVQAATLKQRNIILWLSLAAFLSVCGFVVFVYRQLQVNKKTLTALRQTQNQLIQSEKMASLGELTAGIAHEIQNPLNFVNNFSEVSAELLEELEEELQKGDVEEALLISADVKANLGKIHHHGKRADSIVKGMLEHSRTTSGKKELTDINALADEYLRLSYHGLRAKDKSFNAELVTDFAQDLEKVEVGPQEIGRVLLNLFNNAFYAVQQKRQLTFAGEEAPPYQPQVSVSTKNLGNHIEIRVRDNGMGIPEEIKNKVFQPFFTTKPTGEGTGLGLSLSYDIITKGHGGSLLLESEENEFTQFTILLPAAPIMETVLL